MSEYYIHQETSSVNNLTIVEADIWPSPELVLANNIIIPGESKEKLISPILDIHGAVQPPHRTKWASKRITIEGFVSIQLPNHEESSRIKLWSLTTKSTRIDDVISNIVMRF